MFCGECGTKNKKNAAFCESCGAKLELVEEEIIEKKTKKKEPVETKEVVTVTEKKKMSMKTKVLLILILIVTVAAFTLYKVGENLTSPKTIAKDYIKAVINNDLSELYKYLELEGDKTFVSSKLFKELYKDKESKEKVINYKITDVEYSDLTAKVKFVYTTKSSSSEKTGSVKLIKEDKKKYLIFNSWKMADLETSDLVLKDFTIKAMKNAKVEYAGIKLTNKYLDKKKSSDTIDVYVLPQVFKVKTSVKATLENGIKLDDTVTPSSYNDSYTVEFNINSLKNKEKEEILEVFKDNLSMLYEDAINGKTYEEVKSNYKNASKEFEKNYTNFANSIANGYNKLTKIEFKEAKLSDISINDDGNFVVKVRINYNYTVEYKSLDEVKTSKKSDYNYMTLILGNKDSKYYLDDIKSIGTYFYR